MSAPGANKRRYRKGLLWTMICLQCFRPSDPAHKTIATLKHCRASLATITILSVLAERWILLRAFKGVIEFLTSISSVLTFQKEEEAPREKDTPAAEGDAVVTKVVDGERNRAGDKTWLAEIYVPRPPPMRPGTICVRGPLRFDKNVAEEDSRRLAKAHEKGGYKEVQECRNQLRVEAK
eukprot:701581-Amphidinium_carterae.1